jgi:TolA-binding protein
MTKHVRPKTSVKAHPDSKPKRSRKPDKARKPAPKSNRTREDLTEATQPNPELRIYDRAIALFHAGRFQAAKEAFAELAVARNRDLAHSAELRIRMCEQRLAAAGSTVPNK